MALIKCPECGRKISDTTKNCIHCGYELLSKENGQTQPVEEGSLQNAESKNFVKKKAILWSVIAVGGALLICTVLFFAFRLDKYLMGAIAYSKGDYKSAVQLLSDSEYTLDKNKLSSAKLALAKEYIVSENWLDAYALLRDEKIEEALNVLPEVQYNLAIKHLDAKEWDEAIGLLTGLQFKDSGAVLENATRNKGMTENADFEFLTTIEESIYRRIEITESNNHTYSDIVSAETSRLNKFKDAAFYDEKLQGLATKYLDGLQKQEAALKKEGAAFTIQWQEGIVERYSAIIELVAQYNLFQNDPAFVQEYYAEDGILEEQQVRLAALKALDADFSKQFNNTTWKVINSYQISVIYKNNTTYEINTANINVFYYDKNGTRIDETSFSINSLRKGQTVVCDFYASKPRSIQRCEFVWDFDPLV